MAEPTARAEIDVAAPPSVVYALVSDLPGWGRVAEEFRGGRWLGGVRTARVGARFLGINRNGWRRWFTVSKVTDANGDRFAYEVFSMGVPVSRWQYDISPTPDGSRVVESTWSRVPGWFRPLARVATGVSDRAGRNQRNIEATLRSLKAVAESDAA